MLVPAGPQWRRMSSRSLDCSQSCPLHINAQPGVHKRIACHHMTLSFFPPPQARTSCEASFSQIEAGISLLTPPPPPVPAGAGEPPLPPAAAVATRAEGTLRGLSNSVLVSLALQPWSTATLARKVLASALLAGAAAAVEAAGSTSACTSKKHLRQQVVMCLRAECSQGKCTTHRQLLPPTSAAVGAACIAVQEGLGMKLLCI